MKFYQRLAYYLFGFTIGGIFLYFMVGGKNVGCSYFPNARVLKNIRSKPLFYSDSAKQQMIQFQIDTSDVRKTLTYGDVDFSRSNKPVVGGKRYVVIGKNQAGKPIEIQIINGSEKALINSFKSLRNN